MKHTHVIILFLLSFSLINSQSTVKKNLHKANPESRVILVAVMKDAQSSFKDALIDSLKVHFEPDYQVKKFILKRAKDIYKEEYRLLIVMDKLKANLLFNGKTKELQKTTDIDHVIYFMTTGDSKWKWPLINNHHISSASEKPRLKMVWKELKTKATNLLK